MSEQGRHACALLRGALLAGAIPVQAEQPLADPMRPPRSAVGTNALPGTALVLSYTRIAGTHREALIGDRLVREGDTVAGARVERIERGAVHLRRGDTRETLTFASRNPANARPESDEDSPNDQ